MWEEEGKRYWQRPQRRRRLWAAGFVCVLLVIAALWYAWRVVLPASTTQVEEAVVVPKVQLPSGKQIAACKARKTVPMFCQDRCAVVMHLPPKPFAYRACLSGCAQSAQAGLAKGCNVNALREDDFNCETNICSKVCAEWQSKDPKGRTVRQCADSCRNAHIGACKESISFLYAVVGEGNEL